MLRMVFTGDDLARTRIAAAADPLWELALGIQMLRPQRGDALFGGWRRQARAALREADLGPAAALLVALLPNVGYFPDFLTPGAAAGGIDEGLEAVRRTPNAALAREIALLGAARRLPGEARQLAAGEPRTLDQLTAAMRTVWDTIVAPCGRGIDAALAQERQKRVTAMAEHGVDGLLSSLAPTMIWRDGELRIPGHRDQVLHLDGRGIRLIPAYFCVSGPLTLFDPDLPPVLVYPVRPTTAALPGSGRALDALLGATRAAVLECLHDQDATTTELARRLGISAGSASEHAKILRLSGLVTSRRDRNRVLHTLSELGRALVTHGR
ncbi:winged helix-turn-helix domain-containing protein [Asanoa sp. WMMD1127]|uniref:ArsR/SmtB family transcription factor n=1 Tax=Asanoa sp. WMMD1127 TaxID=3016107 RepID=UPI0024167E09|nr:winged helix-turn-helix domain-containing protein [Asanoa sp. WMMD1127]MDG4820277.1 winged helix-turn-helix domain-containing protein [Asanoa sp. WMMD1127]